MLQFVLVALLAAPSAALLVRQGESEDAADDYEDSPIEVAEADDEVDVHFWVDEDEGHSEMIRQGKARSQQGGRSQQEMLIQGSGDRCLSFIHIPKTAGTSIETAGKSSRKKWAAWDYKMRCSNATECVPDRCCCCAMPDGNTCSRWHVPPMMDPLLQQHYAKCETFCVVRNPVDRYRSELMFRKHRCDEKTLQEDWLHEAKTNPYMKDCHLVPQVKYTGVGETRSCKYILRMEYLERDFNSLMQDFGFKARLTVHNFSNPCNIKLPAAVEAEVRSFYAEDYAAYGY